MDLIPKVKIEIFIPEANLEALSEALFQAGAGRTGHYDHCLNVTEVTGQWRPLEEAKPYQGETGKIFCGREVKVEVNCDRENILAAVLAIRKVHPYEEPVINIVPLLNILLDSSEEIIKENNEPRNTE